MFKKTILFWLAAFLPAAALLAQQPPQLKIESETAFFLCEDHPILLQATDGFDKYQWSNGATGKTVAVKQPGLYYLKAVYQSDTLTDSVTVLPAPPLVISMNVTPVSCFGKNDGSVYLRANGGSGRYLYSINEDERQASSVFADLKPGKYKLTVWDKTGCKAIGYTEILEPSPECIATNVLETRLLSATKAELSWKAAYCYKKLEPIWRIKNQKDWLTAPANANKITIDSLHQGVTYEWALRITCESGKIVYSQIQTFLTSGCQPVTNVYSENLPNQSVKIKWQEIELANRYIVAYRSTKNENANWKFESTNQPEIILQNLFIDQKYEYRIRPQCSNGSEGAYTPSFHFILESKKEKEKITQPVQCPEPILNPNIELELKPSKISYDSTQNILAVQMPELASNSTEWLAVLKNEAEEIVFQRQQKQNISKEISLLKLPDLPKGKYRLYFCQNGFFQEMKIEINI